MSKINQEDLSAFMDGELKDDTDRVIDHLLADANSRDTWMRYHLITEAMRQSLPTHLDRQLPASISEKLQNEPTVLRPARKKYSTYLKPAAGLAIAASVASLAIIGVQQQRQDVTPGLNSNPSIAAVQPNIPAARQMQNPVARPASIDNTRSAPNNRPVAVPQARAGSLNSRLNNYLINYNEYHADAGMQGMLPYARIVAHDRYE